jgi:hypothetical protein
VTASNMPTILKPTGPTTHRHAFTIKRVKHFADGLSRERSPMIGATSPSGALFPHATEGGRVYRCVTAGERARREQAACA